MQTISPHDTQLEKELLGTIINYPNSVFKIIKNLKPELFYSDHNKIVLKAILKLLDEGLIVDSIIVYQECKKLLDEDLGALIAEISSLSSSPGNIEQIFFYLAELYIKREIINSCLLTLQKCNDPTIDLLNIYDELHGKLETVYRIIDKQEGIIQTDAIERTFNDIYLRFQGDIIPYYKTANKQLDDILMLNPKNILLIGGMTGAGKTKFTSKIIFDLFKNNDNISVLWYCMEDPSDKIIRCFISSVTRLRDSQLLSRNFNLTQTALDYIVGLRDTFMSYDIEFVEKPSAVRYISNHFKLFCRKRTDKFNILIIDNLMTLTDNYERGQQTEKDDKIAIQFQHLMNETGGLIILIHHFTAEQLARANFGTGYRPRKEHLKGSTRYSDISTQIMLMNKPGEFPDIIDHYKSKPYVKDIFLTDIVKNRNNKTGLVRWFGDLNTNIFREIE